MEAGRSDRTPEVIAEAAAGMLLIGAMVFGGGPRGGGDAIVHLLALPALTLALLRWRPVAAGRLQRLFAWWLLAAAAVIGLQLLPLPTDVFAALPQRAAVLADLHAAGAAPAWLPMTLDPWGTLRALLALAVFAAMWLLASTLRAEARQRLITLAVLVAVPMALLGFAQAAAGHQLTLRFYAFHNEFGATATFANRNHFASLLAMLLPFAILFGRQAQQLRHQGWGAVWYGSAVILILGAMLTFSRAGVILASLAMATALLLVLRTAPDAGRAHRWWNGPPLLAVVVAAVVIGNYAWSGVVARFDRDAIADLRWQYIEYGWQAVKAYLPWGSGMGSFQTVYAPLEPVQSMVNVYAMHGHDDLLEVAVEAGVPGLLLVLAGLGLPLAAVRKNLMGWGKVCPILAVCWVSVLVSLLHSLVDYPLRTLAVSVLLALVVAQLLAKAPGQTSIPAA